MAGLLAARLLNDHFDEVTLVERDLLLLEDGATRKGNAQGRHAHALLAKGQEILADLFPGILTDLEAAGAERVDVGSDFHWHHHHTFRIRYRSGFCCSFQSRALLESMVRRRVLALSHIRLRQGCHARGLLAAPDGRGVAGVRLEASDGGVEELHADLVVDASGRGSRVPAWLKEIGYEPPAESVVQVNVGYASRVYRRPSPSPHPWKALFVLGTPPEDKRFGVILPIEGDRWIVTLGGLLKDYPPDDDAGFLAFAQHLSCDAVYRAIRTAEPQSDIATYRFPAHLRRHYERMARAPEGLIALGDSLCSFNPIYGQGMTTGALAAVTLDRCLRDRRRARGPAALEGLPAAFYRRMTKVIDVPWGMAVGEDLTFPEVVGKRGGVQPLLRWYVDELHALNGSDPAICDRFYRVQHMIAPPSTLFHPQVALAVLRRQLARLRGGGLVRIPPRPPSPTNIRTSRPL